MSSDVSPTDIYMPKLVWWMNEWTNEWWINETLSSEKSWLNMLTHFSNKLNPYCLPRGLGILSPRASIHTSFSLLLSRVNFPLTVPKREDLLGPIRHLSLRNSTLRQHHPKLPHCWISLWFHSVMTKTSEPVCCGQGDRVPGSSQGETIDWTSQTRSARRRLQEGLAHTVLWTNRYM